MSEKWVSGYHGEDSMRQRAHQMLGHELKAAKKGKIPESMSSPGHTKMRPFAEGGHADGGAMRRGGKARKRAEGGRMAEGGHAEGGRLAEGGNMRRGGHTKRRAEGGKMAEGGDPKFGWGGDLLGGLGRGVSEYFMPKRTSFQDMARGIAGAGKDIYNKYQEKRQSDPRFAGMADMAMGRAKNYLGLKKGGHAHKKHRAEGGEMAEGGHYEEGGHAEGGNMRRGGHSKHHKLTHDQTDMHIPRRAKSPPISRMSQEKAENLRRGGKAGNRLNVESFKEARFAEGGHADGGAMRRGGKAHHHRKHRAEGGDMGGMPPQTPPFGTTQTPQPQMQQPMRKGGHMKHRKASGGSIYEHQMNGEKPSRKAHHYNYESEMRGEHPSRKPSSRHESTKGLVNKDKGQSLFAKGGYAEGGKMAEGGKECTGGAMRRGGHTKRRAEGGKMAEGGKLAAGGVGKIRHNAATASGKPKGARRVIRNDMF